MATRSTYGILNSDKSVTSAYCHFDGYIEGVGYTLLDNYNTEEKVRELLSNGGCSSLGNAIKDSVFYKDRGEDLVITSHLNEDYFYTYETDYLEYHYLFNPILNKWFVSSGESIVELSKNL